MRKETGIAIFLGILAGVGIGAIVLWQTKQSQQSSSQVLQDAAKPTRAANTQELTPLLISSPEPESVLSQNTVVLKGTAPKDSLLVIQSDTGETATKTTSASFEEKVTLIEGQNTIRFTSYNGKTIDSRSIVIYYIPE